MRPTAQDLRPGSVHVWCVDLDGFGARLPQFRAMLSVDERRDGLAIPSDVVRRRYLERKAFQRLVLADYLGVPPHRLSFAKGKRGKPELAGGLGRGCLRFNASSSGAAAVLAVSRSVRVGVDVEAVRPGRDRSDVVDWVNESFDEDWGDADRLDDAAFVRGWTSLEAQAKWSGAGLAERGHPAGAGWTLTTMSYACAGLPFVVSLATRHSSASISGPFEFVASRKEMAWRRS